MITLDGSCDGARIQVASAESFTLRLEENPTTGYRWRLEAAGTPVTTLEADTFEVASPSTKGAPGHHVWRFRGESAGTTTIQLSYRRVAAAARTFTLTVDVR